MGEWPGRAVGARGEIARQHVVGLLAGEGYELVAQGLVDRLAFGEGLGRLGAPPGELVAACAPVASVPLADRGRDMAAAVDLLVAPQRKLPAHVGLQLEVRYVPLDGGPVQGAAGAAREPGAVQEDAPTVDETSLHLALLADLDDAPLLALLLELPLLVGQGLGGPLDAPAVGGVDEVGPVGTAALHELGSGFGEYALAPAAEDAAPVAEHERDVEDPRSFLFGVLEADPHVRALGGLHVSHRPAPSRAHRRREVPSRTDPSPSVRWVRENDRRAGRRRGTGRAPAGPVRAPLPARSHLRA